MLAAVPAVRVVQVIRGILACQTLAVALFFHKDYTACLSACERALALNPLDGSRLKLILTVMTRLVAHAGRDPLREIATPDSSSL